MNKHDVEKKLMFKMVDKFQDSFDIYGHFECEDQDEFFDMVFESLEMVEKSGLDFPDGFSPLASAMFYLTMAAPAGVELDKIEPGCVGGQSFDVMFHCGWEAALRWVKSEGIEVLDDYI